MRRVILESPFRANSYNDSKHNVAYARQCLMDSLQRGEAPIASHLLYPQVLDDANLYDRRRGMLAGQAWLTAADAVVVYEDLGISPGMRATIDLATTYEIPIEYRRLRGTEEIAA
jgi:hypothetical protein